MYSKYKLIEKIHELFFYSTLLYVLNKIQQNDKIMNTEDNGLSRQGLREEIQFLRKEMNNWMSIAVTRDDQLKKAKNYFYLMLAIIFIQTIVLITLVTY
jgi:hypothetical protein